MLTPNLGSDDGSTAALVGGRSRRREHYRPNISRSGQPPLGALLGVPVPYHDYRGDGVLWAWRLDIVEWAVWALAWIGGRGRCRLEALSSSEGRECGDGGIGRYDGSTSDIMAEDVKAGNEMIEVFLDHWDNRGVLHWQKP